jgi:hypothetical protein
MSHDDYFGRPDKDAWHAARLKRAWVPEFVWSFAADLFNLGWHWPANMLSEVPKGE